MGQKRLCFMLGSLICRASGAPLRLQTTEQINNLQR